MKGSFSKILILVLVNSLYSISQANENTHNQGAIYYNIRNFGAKGDSLAKDTHCVQNTIDSCFAHGGGTVYFPPGIYLCGTIHLKSNIALFLDHGSEIRMSKDNEDFDPYEKLDFPLSEDTLKMIDQYVLFLNE